jgi:hypothetical protein
MATLVVPALTVTIIPIVEEPTFMIEASDHDPLFVDEAGDPVLFDKHGTTIVGTPGVSKFFMLGVVHLPDPQSAQAALDSLRSSLLADPYFAGVPSMEPRERKTAVFFHAKDDLPEIRREVFKLLPRFNAVVRVAIRRKRVLAAEASELHKHGHRLTADLIYDDLVKWLFLGLLNPDRHALIVFAKRGKSERLAAIRLVKLRHPPKIASGKSAGVRLL